ncbi:hypothetical protein D3C83_06220 [compost metagenome]
MRWRTLPTPGEPKVSWRSFASAISSLIVFAGSAGLTARSEPCPTTTLVMGVKSRVGLKGSFLWVLGLIANATEV